jgi:hypothetical protein
MARQNTLNTLECLIKLDENYVLENEHGFQVWLECGVQVITNKKRKRTRRGRYAYKFDYPTWKVVGRLSYTRRLKNYLCKVKEWILWCFH